MKQPCVEPALPRPHSHLLVPQQVRMAATSADTEVSGSQRQRRQLQINILTLWQLMLAGPQCQRCGRGLLPNALVSAQSEMRPALALLAWLVCFGFEISKLKQRHKCKPGGHGSVYMIIWMGVNPCNSNSLTEWGLSPIIPTVRFKRCSVHLFFSFCETLERYLDTNLRVFAFSWPLFACSALLLTDLGNLSTAF